MSDYLNVLDFRCPNDGLTDCSQPFQLAINSAIAEGKWLYVPKGRYLFTSGVEAHGSLRLRGEGIDSVLVGSRPLGNGLNISQSLTVMSEVDPTRYTATGQPLTAGSNQLMLDAIGNIVVGSDVGVQLGVDFNDASLPDYFYFAKVIAISGTTVTLDIGSPRVINGVNHQLQLITNFSRSSVIKDLAVSNLFLNTTYTQGLRVSNIYQETGYFFIAWSLCNSLHCEDLYSAKSVCAASGLVQNGTYGTPFYGYCGYDISFKNVWLNSHPFTHVIDNDGGGEDVSVENLTVNLNAVPADPTGQAVLFGTAPSFRDLFSIKNLKINVCFSGARQWILPGGPNFYYENLRIIGPLEVPFGGLGPVTLENNSSIYGILDYNGIQFRDVQSFRRVVLLTPSLNSQVDLGVSGLLRSIRIFVSDASHVTSLASDLCGFNILSNRPLVAGKFVNYSFNIIGSYLLRLFPDILTMNVQTDASIAPATYMVVEGDYFVYPAVVAHSQELVVGAGPPTVAATFLDQRYLDAVDNIYYVAKSVGQGNTDWLFDGMRT